MDEGYKEVRLRGVRPSPWKIDPIPKFPDVHGRKFDGYRDKDVIEKPKDGETPTPPPSPVGSFKYPGLFRGGNVWPKITSIHDILTEACKISSQNTTKPSVAAEIKPSQKVLPQSLQDFLEDFKPASGETKMRLWPHPGNTNCPKIDLSSLTVASEPESVKVGDEKSSNSIEAGEERMLGRCFETISSNDFDVILKHALSHDPVMAKHSSAPQIQRSMTFANKPQGRSETGKKGFPITKQSV